MLASNALFIVDCFPFIALETQKDGHLIYQETRLNKADPERLIRLKVF
jgi:hypothetical protein